MILACRRSCWVTSVVSKCPSLSYIIVMREWPCLSIDSVVRKLFMCSLEHKGQNVSFQQWTSLDSFFTFSLPMSSSLYRLPNSSRHPKRPGLLLVSESQHVTYSLKGPSSIISSSSSLCTCMWLISTITVAKKSHMKNKEKLTRKLLLSHLQAISFFLGAAFYIPWYIYLWHFSTLYSFDNTYLNGKSSFLWGK